MMLSSPATSKMGFYTTWAFVAVFVPLANGNYHFENYKVYNFHGDEEPSRKPWFFEEYSSPYNQHDGGSNYAGSYGGGKAFESVAEQKSPEVWENPAEAYFVASTKRVPNEDKSFKKAISPFYTLTDSDNEKYKSIILKSGAPYCQEIKSKVPKKGYRTDAMTCYKCKDPKNGATYEQCSYTSEPKETVQVNQYVPLPQTLRYRRSNANGQGEKIAKEIPANYRFGEEYFAPAASHEVPAEYKKKMENCDKVVKDSMVCMVCKDPTTNGKYEQCSYTNQPTDKAYAYSKSSSFGNPQGEKKPEESRTSGKQAKRAYSRKEAEAAPESSDEFKGSHPEVDKYFDEQTAAIKSRSPKYRTYEESEESAKLESGSENVKDGSCKKVVKDTMVCTICKDPKTGGNYEQCAYAHHPSDKVYQFTRQKTFGYPEEAGKNSEGKKAAEYEVPSYAEADTKPSDNYKGYEGAGASYYEPKKKSGNDDYGADEEAGKYEYDQPTENQESQEYVPYKLAGEGPSAEDVKSESEKISEEIKDGNCEKVKKDTMTCMVCKDPKTGGNYEQCSYAYEPNDKVFSFSRAKSFGSPEAEEKGSYTGSGENSGSDYGDSGSYGLASDNKPYVASGEAISGSDKSSSGIQDPEKVDTDFFSTAEKKKEIEKVLSEFQQEDRSKCKKVIRDKLTCFQCPGQDGVQKEECIFVAAQEPMKDRVAYREVKEYQRDPAAGEETRTPDQYRSSTGAFVGETRKPLVSKKQKRKTKKTSPANFYPDTVLSASENEEQRREADEDSKIRKPEDDAESEPYDYAAATKPIYDKVLGLTLPRYMLTTSEHEIEFDEVVASSKI